MVAENGRMGCQQEGGGELEANMSEQDCCIIPPYKNGKTIDSSICGVYCSAFFVLRLGKSEVNITVIPVRHRQLSASQHHSSFVVNPILINKCC